MAFLEITRLSKAFKDHKVIDNASIAIDKGEFASQSKYDQEELEKVPVAAALGAATAEEAATGFTDKDYSNYNPDEAAKKDDAPVVEEPEIDEDKLYKE